MAADVAAGEICEITLPDSRVYPGYRHETWLYRPAGYDDVPLALMIFLDGGTFMSPDGDWNVPSILHELISSRRLSPMAAVFINSGKSTGFDELASEQRSYEYDTVGGAYASFLVEEVLPAVARHVQISSDPASCGIAGASSGGICAFNAAWHRPDVFSKVFSAIGSFVDIRGGGAYPELIRSVSAKPIRVFLQDGAFDGLAGQFTGLDWVEGNRAMARSLAFMGYDYQLVMGSGVHDFRDGAAMFPSALRWLWRDYSL